MQKAKEAINSILHKDSHNDADISQHVSEPVTHEQVHEHKTHHNTAAVDREVHEDHHQTTVQPVKDKEILPEKHHHNVLPAETEHHHHGKSPDVERRLQEERARFHDTTEVLPERHHHGDTKAAVGEHHHHHIHEHVQPVIEKQTIQPHVVHNVAPVHEVIEKEPVVHKQSLNPAMTMQEFKSGALAKGGHGTEHHDYKGDPLHVGKDGHIGREGHHHHHHHGGESAGTTVRGSNITSSGQNAPDGARGERSHPHDHPFSKDATSGASHREDNQHGYNTSSGTGHGGGTGLTSSDKSSSEPRYSGLDENIIGHHNVPGTDSERHEHTMRETMRDGSDHQEKSTGRSLLDKLTGK